MKITDSKGFGTRTLAYDKRETTYNLTIVTVIAVVAFTAGFVVGL